MFAVFAAKPRHAGDVGVERFDIEAKGRRIQVVDRATELRFGNGCHAVNRRLVRERGIECRVELYQRAGGASMRHVPVRPASRRLKSGRNAAIL